jgi:hypothetical protein
VAEERADEAADGQLRAGIEKLCSELASSASMTHPSRKSDIERRVTAALALLLDGQPADYL